MPWEIVLPTSSHLMPEMAVFAASNAPERNFPAVSMAPFTPVAIALPTSSHLMPSMAVFAASKAPERNAPAVSMAPFTPAAIVLPTSSPLDALYGSLGCAERAGEKRSRRVNRAGHAAGNCRSNVSPM